MQKTVLHVTNGEYFNKYFLSKYGSVAVPFCEAMMDGETHRDVFSDSFVSLRAKCLKVSEEEYRQKMYVPQMLGKSTYQEIHLWFGKDTFCQLNLLAILAYLEQISYVGAVKLHYVDDHTFEVLEDNIDVSLGVYQEIYCNVLMKKVREHKVPGRTAVI